jgi:tetratricopeptide (TPR) repeat protein
VLSLKSFAGSLLTLFTLPALLAFFAHGQTPSAAMQQALAAEQQGNYVHAADILQSLTAAAPHNAQAWAHLGLDRALEGKYAEAVPAYRKALALDPKLPGLQIDLGLALFKQDRLREAIPALLAAAGESPSDNRPKFLLGMSYYGSAQYPQAIPFLRLAVAVSPDNLGLLTALAQSCLWAAQYSCALEQYKALLEQSPDSAQAYMIAGEALDGEHDTVGAIAQFRAAEKVAPNTPDLHFGLGYLLWKSSQPDEAERELKLELALDPNHVQALTYLADMALKKGDQPTAQAYLSRAVVHDDGAALTYLDLGILAAAAIRNLEAEADFKRSIALAPDQIDAHWRLSRLSQLMGNKAQAEAELSKVRQLHASKDEVLVHKLGPTAQQP